MQPARRVYSRRAGGFQKGQDTTDPHGQAMISRKGKEEKQNDLQLLCRLSKAFDSVKKKIT